jgi:hypothetical protein
MDMTSSMVLLNCGESDFAERLRALVRGGLPTVVIVVGIPNSDELVVWDTEGRVCTWSRVTWIDGKFL